MDVHAPHEPIHSWRDFGIHLTVVTIGLCIALMLEALVEHIHNRHLLREAREDIRQEIENNHRAAQQDLVLVQKNIDVEKANIQAIHRLQDHPADFHGSVTNSMDFNSADEAAWKTARDTGALSLMPYAEVQRYADLYMLADLVNQQAITTGTRDYEAAAPFDMGVDPGHLPAEEYARLLHDNALVQIRLVALQQYVAQFDQMCLAELKR